MGRPTKKQARKAYNYDRNRRREWKKKKRLPAIRCAEIKESYDRKKSLLENLKDMGLSADPNKTLHIKSTKEQLVPMEIEEVDKETLKNLREKTKPKKEHVVKAIEADASRPAAKTNKLSEPEVQYCVYMMEKYGEDYKAMARDSRNHYQETAKQIKKKINMFKNTSSQYEAYLKSKVESAWDQVQPAALCCSPVPTDIRTVPERKRRITRKYEASRRNGHFSRSPDDTNDVETVTMPVSLSRVRRKLKFGRKPPRSRPDS